MNLLMLLLCSASVGLALPVFDQISLEDDESVLRVIANESRIILNPDDYFDPNFDPEIHNVYHLFTRKNPSVSQPIVLDQNGIYGTTNFDPKKRTIVLIHGWLASVATNFNSVLTAAILEAEDVNVIAIDWSRGARNINYVIASFSSVRAGASAGRFLTKLNEVTGADPVNYHILGFSLGGHMAGNIGRNMDGKVAYITAMDPAGPFWENIDDRFRPSDGLYTEVIHTHVDGSGFLKPLGDVDFYPNGGTNMPGCNIINIGCNHERSFYYIAESILSGGFTSRRCDSYNAALTGDCDLEGTLLMGGLKPKTGLSGVYYLETNASPPFSKG